MDNLDKQILRLLASNARMTVKEISGRVALTSPAVSERIRRMEKEGVIAGYTVLLGRGQSAPRIDALISISVPHTDKDAFLTMVESLPHVRQCYHVTGSHSFIAMVNCADMAELEHLINRFQQVGQTSTQIILSAPVDRNVLIP